MSRASRRRWSGGLRAALVLGCFGLLVSCRDDMEDRGKVLPLEPSLFFADGRSARDLVPGTIAQGAAPTSATRQRQDFGKLDEIPVAVNRRLLLRGQAEFNIYCAVCHGALGYGDGMVVRRGFTPPPSYHTPALRQATLGHFVDVITNGIGAMYSYSERVTLDDRWAIAAYIRVLQLSQHAEARGLPPEDLRRVPGLR
jgi:mono/diheme cytochrome c family protein